MVKKHVTADDFMQMMRAGALQLQRNGDRINALNVFPVPDGDTGTNMNLTLTSGVQEMEAKFSGHLGKLAQALSKGLLMGARGNSGVILSQLFRGFAKAAAEWEKADVRQLAAALQQGVDTAYQAVVKPVEGTILTVAREAAKRALAFSSQTDHPLDLMREVTEAAKRALSLTPEQLPILKQVGVVDAGGQGLVFLYEGFVQALSGELPRDERPSSSAQPEPEGFGPGGAHAHVQAQLSADTIEHGYCTEFIIRLDASGRREFREPVFREELERLGDSIVVVADDDLVKVHIHAEYPGTVMNHAMKFGELSRIKIENMREQHAHLAEGHGGALTADDGRASSADGSGALPEAGEALKPWGFVAVATGAGIEDIFRSLGADEVVTGGQTMNPSTEDLLSAIERVRAETVFVLPNNSNIILAAEQAKALAGKAVFVIATKTVPQGLAAMLAFSEHEEPERNAEAMAEVAASVKSGSVTYAVRNSQIDGITISEGDYIAMVDNRIAFAGPNLADVCKQLLERMVERGDEVVTLLEGQEADAALTDELSDYLAGKYPDIEIERHHGGQPLYYYWISVE